MYSDCISNATKQKIQVFDCVLILKNVFDANVKSSVNEILRDKKNGFVKNDTYP